MGITREIPAGEPFELAGRIVGLERETGRAVPVERRIRVRLELEGGDREPGPGGQHRPLREA